MYWSRNTTILTAFVILNIRGLIGSLGCDTLWLTILMNLLLLASVDYRKVKSAFFFLPLFSLLLVYNKEILGPINILTFVYLLRNTSLRSLAFININLLLAFSVLMLFMHTFGIIHSKEWIMPKGVALDFGFANPNALGSFVYILMLNLYILFHNKSKLILPILILIVTQIIYQYSLSRTAYIGGIILIIIHFLSLFHLIRPSMRYLIAILPFLFMGIIFYFTLQLSIYPIINQLFSGRLTIYATMLENMSAINWLIGLQLPIGEPMDSSFLMLLFSGGLTLFLLFSITFFQNTIIFFNNIKSYLPIILSILTCGIVENIFSSASGISLIFWLLIFYPPNIHKSNKLV